MPTTTKLACGNWRVQVRRKGCYAADTFRRRRDAEEWALDTERCIDQDIAPKRRPKEPARTFGDLIDLHVRDMHEVGKPPRRSKAAVMQALKVSLDGVKIVNLNRERLIDYGKDRAKVGAGPATLAIDFSFIRTILSHAAAVHGIEVSAEDIRLARIALKRLGLIGKGIERNRRPTPGEVDDLIEYFERNPRQLIPMGRLMRFAVATAMRQEEICRIEWSDVDMTKKTVRAKDRKNPRHKEGNHQKAPLLNLTGYDAWQVLLEQRIITRGQGRVFPHNSRSVGTAFRRACRALAIAVMRRAMEDGFGNPSSPHWAGGPAHEMVETGRRRVADLLGCTPDEIVFTSGGSESNNFALKGAFYASSREGTHIIMTRVEHPAIVEPCRFLERLGTKITWLPVDGTGRIEPDDMRRAITGQGVRRHRKGLRNPLPYGRCPIRW